MKKPVSGIMLTLLLIIMGFHAIPVLTQPTIKIGVIGPMGWPQGSGMWNGATLAKDQINALGVNVGGEMHQIQLVAGDEIIAPFDPAAAVMEMEELIAGEEVDFVVGGFRSENVFAMREVAMDYQKIFIITGAATNELIDCGTGTCGACVRCDYDRYKYVFRVTPPNETTLARSLLAFLQGYVIPQRLLPLYGEYLWPGAPNKQVKVAVIAEDLQWTEKIFVCLTNPAYYPVFLGPYANVTYMARVDPNTIVFGPHLTAIIANEARLIVHLFSGQAGVNFILQWRGMGVEAVPVGINVMGQQSDHWIITTGGCEYETFLAASGTRTPWGWDIYTAFGAYDAIYTLAEAIERAGTIDSDAVVAELEQTDRVSTLGNFQFTGPNPNHPGVGTLHDVFVNEIGPTWTQGFVRPLVVQWQDGVLEVIWPADQTYSKEFLLSSSMPNLRAVTDVKPYKTVVGQGLTSRINVTVTDMGSPLQGDSITVAAYYDNGVARELIQEFTFLWIVPPWTAITLTFTWNTAGVVKGSYTISATADNIYVDGVVNVGMPGDVDVDTWITIADVSAAAIAFGSYPGHPDWFPNGDFDDDDFITIADVSFVAGRFGEHDP